MQLASRTATATATLLQPPSSLPSGVVDHLARLINSHPLPLDPLLRRLPSPLLASPLLDALLARLFAAHAHASKPLRLLLFSLPRDHLPLCPDALASALHHLARARDFPSAFALLDAAARSRPHLLTPRALAVILSRHAKFRPFDATLDAFARLEQTWALAGLLFGAPEFNALLRAFCARGRVAEAKAAFRQLHRRFPPDARTLNTLLLGFKESGNLLAFDLFFHDMTARGFRPDAVTYCIRIDAYCKKGRFADALELFDEMGRRGLEPTVQTMTTLVHGAGIAKNALRARRLFDEIAARGLSPDRGAYNALMGAFVRVGDLARAAELMDEMEEKGFGLDDVSYFTLLCGLKRDGELEGFWKLYGRMVEKSFVPRTRTVMLLMKVFCENGRAADSGLELWDYLVEKGCCPHRHALDLLITGLCCRGEVAEAIRCFRQFVERERVPSERAFRVLEGFLMRAQEAEKVEELRQMMNSLHQRSQSPVPF